MTTQKLLSVFDENPACAYFVKVCRVNETPSVMLDTPEVSRDYWRNVIALQDWYDPEKEQLVVLLLSTRFRVQAFSLVSMGSVNESIAHPREVFRPVIAAGSYAFILMHNHPSGDPSPSQADHGLTRRLREGAELLQLKFLDHVIIGTSAAPLGDGKPDYFSFKEMGVL